MVTLAQQSLHALIKSGAKIDYDEPVIRDQLFSVKMTRDSHLARIRKLKVDTSDMKHKIYDYANFTNIAKVNYYMIDKLCVDFATELFDRFPWKQATSPSQAVWKEYFHAMYDLIVPDQTDHIGNLIMMYEIVKYHDVIDVPTVPIDIKDTHIHTIKGIIDTLKREQLSAIRMMGDLRFQLNESVRYSTQIQLDIAQSRREMNKLSEEVRMLSEILEY